MATKRRRKFVQVRHPFLYTVNLPDGSHRKLKAWARVIPAKAPVTIVLTEQHVTTAINQHGEGDSARCAGSVCMYEHRDLFPHNIVGWTDWWSTRVFVGSKLDARGLPTIAYAYEHNNNVAKLFDTEAGQQRLLNRLRKHGAVELHLLPYRQRSKPKRPGHMRLPTGKRINHRVGHNLRAANFKAGWSKPA
jgi:hypothetical protein